MISDVSNTNLMVAINTSVLKKSMDTNEALMSELVEGLESISQDTTSQTSSSNVLDIYA